MALSFGTPFTYATLVGDVGTEGSIKSWGSHAAIPADQVLTEAQQFIYRTLRVREMIQFSDVQISQGDQSLALPDGWQSQLFMRLNGDQQDLDYKHESWVRFKQSDGTMATGRPNAYMILDQIYFDVEADSGDTGSGYAGEMAFYGTPAALSSGNQSNFLCTKYATLLRLVCTGFAYQSRRRLSDADDVFAQASAALQLANVSGDEFRRTQIGLR